MMTVHAIKIRTRWNSATTAKITPATRENVFASMSKDSTQGGGSCERFGQSDGWVEPAGWKAPSGKYIDVLLAEADPKERIARKWARARDASVDRPHK